MVAPTYYADFRCIADKCRHNCCIGWEIDIDAETAARYRALPGADWAWLREGIAGDPPHFVLDREERCPCLREDNLCRLILTLGEDSLCQICRDHPRFRNFWPEHTEIGVGASCEAAARLILGQKEPLALTEDGTAVEGEEEQALYDLRAALLSLVYDESRTIPETEEAILRMAGTSLDGRAPEAWILFYLRLARLDEAWTGLLTALLEQKTQPDAAAFERHMAGRGMEYRNMLAYFLYRHVSDALDDGDPGSKAAFAVLSCRLLRALGTRQFADTGAFTFEDQAELFRMYSAEIEYSEENLETLYDALWQEIK